MNEPLELLEEYNQEGICVRRSINGHELPTDTVPSVTILNRFTSVTQKKYMTREEVKNKCGLTL